MLQVLIKYSVPAIRNILPVSSVLLSFIPLWLIFILIITQHINYYYAMKLIE